MNVLFNKKGFISRRAIISLPLYSPDPGGPFRYLEHSRKVRRKISGGPGKQIPLKISISFQPDVFFLAPAIYFIVMCGITNMYLFEITTQNTWRFENDQGQIQKVDNFLFCPLSAITAWQNKAFPYGV